MVLNIRPNISLTVIPKFKSHLLITKILLVYAVFIIVTVANIRTLLGVYYGVRRPDAGSKVVMKAEQASASEDEGEVISSDDNDDSEGGTAKVEPLKPSVAKEEKDEAKKIK